MKLQINMIVGLLAFLFIGSTIILKSYLDPEGFLTNDSSHYLAVAQRFLDGHGFTVLNLFETESMSFSRWPIGYPFLIAIISVISGLPIFWASKFLNILFMGLCILILLLLFKKRACIYILLFAAGAYMQIFTLTWSEVPFIFGMLWLIFGLHTFIVKSENKGLVHIFAASLSLFFSRYIGFISVPILVCVAFIFILQRNHRKAVKLLASAFLTFLICAAYLFNNFLQTGYITGISRSGAKETAWELTKQLLAALASEVNLIYAAPFFASQATHTLITVVSILVLLAFLVLAVISIKKDKNHLLAYLFLFVGMSYYAGILFLRFTSDFDPFGYRLLAPGTLLVIIGLMEMSKELKWRRWPALALTGILILSFYINGPKQILTALEADQMTYPEKIEHVKEKYKGIPSDSLIAFGDRQLQYVRTDSRQIYIYTSMDEFFERIESSTADHVYIEIIENINRDYYDESVIRFMDMHQGVTFVKVK